jgi:signal transduction histidine kinase
MYVLKREEQGKRAQPRPALAAIEPALARCVAQTDLSCAFIAIARETRGRESIAIRAHYTRPDGADQRKGPPRLSDGMRQALRSALDACCPILVTSQRGARAHGYPRTLIGVPLIAGGRARGLLGAVGRIPAPYARAAQAMRRIASELDTSPLGATPTPAPVGGNEFIRAASARQDFLLHELRVPLSAASILLERLARLPIWEPLSEDASDHVRAAYAAVREAQNIVRTLSQLQALNQDSLPVASRPIQIQEIIERAIALLPGSVGRLRRSAPKGLPDVVADPLWLTHILTNLLENAMTHTPAPHVADMTAALAPDRQRVVVSITSYGAGIPIAEQERILAPYQRLAAADDLTSKGLGLSIARYLVSAMRGELWLESDGLNSATFHVALPTAARDARDDAHGRA